MKCRCVVILAGWVLLSSACLRGELPPDAAKKAIAYLKGLENKDGGYRATAAEGPSALGATSSAIRAQKYLGAGVPSSQATKDFVVSCFDRGTHSFADKPGGKSDVRLTAVGSMAGVELGLGNDDVKDRVAGYLSENAKDYEQVRIAVAGLEALGKTTPKAAEWRKQIEGLANADGIWGKGDGIARETGGSAVILLRLGVKLKDEALVLKVLDAGLRPDGGYGKADVTGSDLETTYRVMRCYHMLKKQPAGADKIRAFVAKCQNADGGFGVAPGQPSNVSATYFAAVVSKWLDAK